MKKRGLNVAVCVPARDEVHTGFAFDFARMCANDSIDRCAKTGGKLMLYTMAGTLIFDQREKLVSTALSEGADVVVFIDSDMRFPPDLINIMLSREVPIVGVNATTRREPTIPTACNLFREYDDEGNVTKFWWEKVDSRDKNGIEKITAVGFGAVMIRKEVFESTPTPWFDVKWGKSGIIGEDIHFCVKAGDHGFDTYVDHELSMHIRHIGIKEYGWHNISQTWQEDQFK